MTVAGERPAHGARFTLTLIGVGPDARADYACTIATPTIDHHARVRLAEDGGVEVLESDAPDALASALAMFAKLTARGAPVRRDDGLATWPPRVQRWRPDK